MTNDWLLLLLLAALVSIPLAWSKGYEQGQEKERDDRELDRKSRERMLEENGYDPTPCYFPKGKRPLESWETRKSGPLESDQH